MTGCGGDNKATSTQPRPIEALCKDGVDNDQDGQVDCADVDCQSPGGDCTPAPPLDRTVASTLAETAAFLYMGDNPLQRDADPKSFEPRRVAMLHGRVMDAAGTPLAGVRVSARDHREYGYTFTRADGAYDLAVNGGSRLLLDVTREGYLPAQRVAQPGWQRHAPVDDLGLAAAVGTTSTVNVNASESQTITGNVATDARGRREPLVSYDPIDRLTDVRGKRRSDERDGRSRGSSDVSGPVDGRDLRRMGTAGLEERSPVRRKSQNSRAASLHDGQVVRRCIALCLRMARRAQKAATPSTQLIIAPH